MNKKVYRLTNIRLETDIIGIEERHDAAITVEARNDDDAFEVAAEKLGHGIEAATVVELLS